ncbi:MAG: DUF5069 domain-containing protein [Verrucomicrobia bacterium]|nr:DUF5069 domain-containing protein [Verrucomicrobiota bacterium]
MSATAPRLRPPQAELGGCCWLPRLIDKARRGAEGELPLLYRLLLGSAAGIDGQFLRWFRLRRAETLAALRAAPDDAAALAWFLAQPGVGPERIAKWNAFAPTLGAPGGPMRWSFGPLRALVYSKVPAGRANNYFELIAEDERPAS